MIRTIITGGNRSVIQWPSTSTIGDSHKSLLLGIFLIGYHSTAAADTLNNHHYQKYSISVGFNFITSFPMPPILGSKNLYGTFVPQQLNLLNKYKVNRGIALGFAINSREFAPRRGGKFQQGQTASIDFISISVDHLHFKQKPKGQYGFIESVYLRHGYAYGQRVFWGMNNNGEGITGRYYLFSPGIGLGFIQERFLSNHVKIGYSIKYCYYFETPKYPTASDKYILEDMNSKPNRRVAAFSVFMAVSFKRLPW